MKSETEYDITRHDHGVDVELPIAGVVAEPTDQPRGAGRADGSREGGSLLATRIDWLVGVALVGVCLLGWDIYVRPHTIPYEDAAMLLRYAANLAHGGGLTYNVLGPHVDGATDFFPAVLIGGFVRLGMTAESAVRSLDLAAHLVTVFVVYLTGRRFFRAPVLVALAPALFLAWGPALLHAAAFFATPIFGMFVALTMAAAFACRAKPTSRRAATLLAVAALVMSLTRPEGVLLTSLIVAASVWWVGKRNAAKLLLNFAPVYVVGGAIYFVWHWIYYRYPLPNPYYKKGGGTLHPEGLIHAFENVARGAWPLLVILGVGLLIKRSRREAIFVAIPAIGFTVVWVLLSDETNFAGRFQYPVLVVLAMGCAPIACAFLTGVRLPRPIVIGSILLLPVVLFADVMFLTDSRNTATPASEFFRRADVPIAQQLRGFGPAARMAVTEAGLLPYESGWRTLDTWGLNDTTIAHRGFLTLSDLSQFRPDLLMLHAYSCPMDTTPTTADIALGSAWLRMTDTMTAFARAHRYQLAAVYGGEHDCQYFYVRPNWASATAVTTAIRQAGHDAGLRNLTGAN